MELQPIYDCTTRSALAVHDRCTTITKYGKLMNWSIGIGVWWTGRGAIGPWRLFFEFSQFFNISNYKRWSLGWERVDIFNMIKQGPLVLHLNHFSIKVFSLTLNIINIRYYRINFTNIENRIITILRILKFYNLKINMNCKVLQ